MKMMCDPSAGVPWCDPPCPMDQCCGPHMNVGRIRRKLKAGFLWNTWDCYRHNGVQDQAPCTLRIGVPRRYFHVLPTGTPLQQCGNCCYRY